MTQYPDPPAAVTFILHPSTGLPDGGKTNLRINADCAAAGLPYDDVRYGGAEVRGHDPDDGTGTAFVMLADDATPAERAIVDGVLAALA